MPQVRLERLQVLQIHRTDRAPAREEVHDDGLADEIPRREGLAIERLRLEAGKGAAPELLRNRRDERRVRAIDGQDDSERSGEDQGLPATAPSILTRHPLHASPSLRDARRAPSAPSTRRLTSSQSTFSMRSIESFRNSL